MKRLKKISRNALNSNYQVLGDQEVSTLFGGYNPLQGDCLNIAIADATGYTSREVQDAYIYSIYLLLLQ